MRLKNVMATKMWFLRLKLATSSRGKVANTYWLEWLIKVANNYWLKWLTKEDHYAQCRMKPWTLGAPAQGPPEEMC